MAYSKIAFFSIFVVLIVCIPVIAEEDGKVIFERVIVPFMNISLAGDTYELLVLESDPDELILKQGQNMQIIPETKPLETDDFTFEVVWKRFNASKTSVRDASGTPLFGTYHPEIGELNSYLLRVYLKKPVIEISHTLNDKYRNSEPENIFSFDLFEPINITTGIHNHGIYSVDARLVEMIPKEFDVILPENSSAEVFATGDEEYDKQIIFETELSDTAEIQFQLYPKAPITFPFKTRVYYEYNDLSYTVVERNKTTILSDSQISTHIGFHNNKQYTLSSRAAEVGESLDYGVVIKNYRDEDLENVTIAFSAEDVATYQKTESGLSPLYDNAFSKIITINAKNTSSFIFSLTGSRRGNYSITPKISYVLHGETVVVEKPSIFTVYKQPLQPKIVFNSSKENATSEILIYLMNPNKNASIKNLQFNVETLFGAEWDSFAYTYPDIDINESFLVNRLTAYIYNTSGDYVRINGSFTTAAGEIIPFSITQTPREGADPNYYKIAATISQENNLDLRYDEAMALYDRKRPVTFSERMSQFTTNIIQQSSGETKNNYVVPVLVFITIMLVQGIQYLKRKKQAEQ